MIERVDIPPRAARYAPAPAPYSQGRVGRWLTGCVGGGQPYFNQSSALEVVARGSNLVVATPTASGKSLVFMAAALEEIVNGDGRVLVFYPQKMLGGDQFARWQRALERLGLEPNLVGEITGEVSMYERERVLERARIILATPDVIHCWLMRMLHLPAAAAFLKALKFVVIDEAHTLDGVFGSHFAFFFRRLRDARWRAGPMTPEPQVIAATATLRDPAEHLAALTGLSFEVIGEDQNGAPAHGVTLLHIDGPDVGAASEKAGADIMTALLDKMSPAEAAIAFADSRQGVERIARRVNRTDAKPYRSGFNPAERRSIEGGLRAKDLKAIFSTSASELGIDIPQFAYGLNVGIPSTRKSLRQRCGRVGRAQPGVFAVMAPSAAFARLGSSLRESITGPVEASPLYLSNPFIQFQQARCYLRELGSEDCVPELRSELGWPDGFAGALEMALPGAERPRVLDDIANTGWDNPHLAYFLRSMPSISFALKNARNGETIGTIDHEKALREAYPGATYIHLGAHYRVIDWFNTSYEQTIKLQPIKRAEPTHPLTRFQISASVEAGEVVDGHLLASAEGCLVEAQLRAVESVEGYRIGTTSLLYRELLEKDRRMRRKQREFMTVGVVMRIQAPWFAGTSESQVATRRAVAEALQEVITREYGISPGDLRAAHSGIAFHSITGARKVDDAVAVFDTVPGGLRLSSPLFSDFAAIIARLERGAELAGEEALLPASTVQRLEEWHSRLTASEPHHHPPQVGEGKQLIFAPSSRVSVKIRGQTVERVLLEPQMLAIGGGEQLMYRYEDLSGSQAWVAHDQVEPIGNDWQRAIWNPINNHIEPLEVNI
ncbi:DEAD/DEAH box helicase [Parafrankia sp. BMG5.11]|uniref:DEAD/DEAH box helicase n=1 Tax=Parafrankia sp. BMG5.11 TaxID=222540 RepID=UPI0014049A87|nr:DEAD/DEAH box helicase [Parafrankia sp. BMG5.11]